MGVARIAQAFVRDSTGSYIVQLASGGPRVNGTSFRILRLRAPVQCVCFPVQNELKRGTGHHPKPYKS